MDSKLFGENIKGEEGMAGIEALLNLPMAALHFAVISGRVWTNQLVADTEIGGGVSRLFRVGRQKA